nr:MAG TPA: hypothetical protein [Caudoviricetes sp.]
MWCKLGHNVATILRIAVNCKPYTRLHTLL